ncbi:MAG TPA: 4'-phosphopantetheinyl transferase superfamily protein [Casimicrobiaceae bacterium]|nr:4'-phosphopantetheinyl transferase superfamily protein [Casimicrobiaceae bacterium]
MCLVGNDVIDLAAGHNRGRAQNRRLVERTLTAAERGLLAADGDDDRSFARLWSAKEAAYKAVRKCVPALVFAPRRWQVELARCPDRAEDCEGSVMIAADMQVAVRWRQTNDWIHCVALLGGPPELFDEGVATAAEVGADGASSERERDGFTCAESGGVRTLAKRLLRRYGAGAVEIVRARIGAAHLPPRVYAGAAPMTGVDLSLSHDGRFVAAAIAMERRSIAPA